MPSHEDRAITRRLKLLGLPMVHKQEVTVYALSRLEGRALGGMTATLRDRAANPDAPLCPDMGRSDNSAMKEALDTIGPLRTQADLPLSIKQIEHLMRKQFDKVNGSSSRMAL